MINGRPAYAPENFDLDPAAGQTGTFTVDDRV